MKNKIVKCFLFVWCMYSLFEMILSHIFFNMHLTTANIFVAVYKFLEFILNCLDCILHAYIW